MFLSEEIYGKPLDIGGGTELITARNNTTSITGSQNEESGSNGGLYIGVVFFYTFVAFLGLLSNTFVLLTVFKRYVSRNTVNTFLCSLATSDLLMVILSMMDFATFLNGTWVFGEVLCKIQSYILEINFTASTLTLVAVSFERYLLICHPYMKRRSIKSIYKIIGAVWLIAFLICSPLLHGYAVTEEMNRESGDLYLRCHNTWGLKGELAFYSTYSAITYLFPFVLMAFAHWRISLSIKENNDRRASASAQSTLIKEKKSSVCYTIREEPSSSTSTERTAVEEVEPTPAPPPQQDSPLSSKGLPKSFLRSISGLSTRTRSSIAADREIYRREKRVKAIRLLFVVTITFFMLWTPFIILRLLRDAGVHVNKYLYTFSEIIIFSSTAVNGFIYAFISRPFRNAFKAILCCRTHRDAVSRDSGPSMSNSEDNRLANRGNNSSRGSVTYSSENKNGNAPKIYSQLNANGHHHMVNDV